MDISLGPSRFYGKSLPRPRFYTDVKFNDHRVDPPLPVTDAFMSWAEEAHWSMGGLSFKRLRLQGKIEGNANKLRSQLEIFSKAHNQSPSPPARSVLTRSKRSALDAPSPPDAPFAVKRRRFMSAVDEGEAVVTRGLQRKRLVKKLGEEFDLVASENEVDDESVRVGSKLDLDNSSGNGSEYDSVGLKRRRRLMKGGEAVGKVAEEDVKNKLNLKEKSDSEKNPISDSGNRVRTSPRLSKLLNN